MSYSKREKRQTIWMLDKAIEEAGLDVVYVRVRVPSHALLIVMGAVVVLFSYVVHGV